VGGKVVVAMKRTGEAGEFRSNLHRGGSAKKLIKISPEERSTAVRAAGALRSAVSIYLRITTVPSSWK
jgi:ribosomal protein S6--L-glutamate ligase